MAAAIFALTMWPGTLDAATTNMVILVASAIIVISSLIHTSTMHCGSMGEMKNMKITVRKSRKPKARKRKAKRSRRRR